MARQLVLTITTEVIADDLLAPVGDVRPVDDEPSVVKVSPDKLLATGLALSAGAAAAVAVAVLTALIRPARRQRVRNALAIAGISRPVAVLDAQDQSALAEIEVLSAAAGRPVRVVALTPSTEPSAAQFSAALAAAGVPMADDRSDEMVSIVGLASETVVEKLTGAIAALPEQARLIAVVLTASRHRRHIHPESEPESDAR
jgi:hypothetical protein